MSAILQSIPSLFELIFRVRVDRMSESDFTSKESVSN